MSKSRHTPGPWHAQGVMVWSRPEARGEGHMSVIANARTADGDACDEWNARLIAAAPDTYAELVKLVGMIERDERIEMRHLKGPRAAIAKTEGAES